MIVLSDISIISTSLSRKSLIKDPFYRVVNLAKNNIYIYSFCKQYPKYITNLVGEIYIDYNSLDLSLN